MTISRITTAFFALSILSTGCDLARITAQAPQALPCEYQVPPVDDVTARPTKVGDCDGGLSICDVPGDDLS